MPTKTSPSMLSRFNGKVGARKLATALCHQHVAGGNLAIAKAILTAGEILDIRTGKVVIQQGDSDNDIYFIISGEISITVNAREVAIRRSGQHIGEMAMLDPTARRSATATATERSILIKITETKFTTLASKYPELWRRLAVELAARLRERSRFLSQPHAQPVVFVGSSSEYLGEAKCISDSLNRRPVISRLWSQGVFQLSKTTVEDLIKTVSESDFAVLLLTPDDMTASRGRRKSSPRDNAVFELGLFMGGLGRERAFIVTPNGVDLKLPTDLLGITRIQYALGSNKSLGKRFSPVTRALWNSIQQLGVK